MLVDITAPPTIEVQIREDGKVIWVHTDADGFDTTVLRACRIGKLTINDERKSDAPSYLELVRALASTLELASVDVTPFERAKLEAARKLLLRAQAAQ